MINTFTLTDNILGFHFRHLGGFFFFFLLSNYLGTTSMNWIFGSCAGFWFSHSCALWDTEILKWNLSTWKWGAVENLGTIYLSPCD